MQGWLYSQVTECARGTLNYNWNADWPPDQNGRDGEQFCGKNASVVLNGAAQAPAMRFCIRCSIPVRASYARAPADG